ncbi:sigma factor-like helix-turn-helix DNA-binding protein [Thermostaphylospora chromogena]|uniref:Sigma-70, region 4 n=1 Tax=Thermostaphylospora chromogena TaxID=35622 RepID=A0A1H1B1E2_9ACTN|nr:sigma factor-like helix-turn-helix DNA-binding protein [Thermostaphylospora chromogena]SDQ45765.1 Sigma-70, region 4 [Thermostaphylospora chromogena]
MNLSLSDIVPPLRWTSPAQIAPIADDPRLPQAWWQALPLDRACAVLGTQQVAARLADLSVACWGHLVLGDVLPLLRFTDPADAGSTTEQVGRDVVLKLFTGVLERLLEPVDGKAASRAIQPDRPLPELIDSFFSGLDERQRTIARDRLYATQRATLDELAQRFSVTRERIRQIERDLRDDIDRRLAEPDAAPLAAHVTWLRGRLGSAVPAEDLVAAAPWHNVDLPSLGIPAWRFVRTLLTGYDQVDGWLVAGGADELREKTRQLFTDGPRPLAEAVSLVAQLGVREDVAERWLMSVPHLRVLDGHVVAWPRSVNDKAEAVLAIAGTPLTPEEIQERIGEDYSLVGIRNQLTADDRFLRVDRNKYGLARWGGEQYLGIREMIVREIERAGGEAPVNTIVANLTSRYDVSESSVRAYAGGPGFERTQRGWIRVAGQEPTDYQPRRDVSETRRCFRSRDGRWWHRVDVNAEHLRGSGSPLPTGFAAYLGMAPGGQLTASAPSGDVVISWHNQPTMGSIRAVLAEYGAQEGDHIFLTVSDGGELLTRFLQAAPPNLPPLNRALHLIGYTAPVASEAEGLRLIGARIGLPEGASKEEILARLRDRGDREILAFLEGDV